MCADLSRRRIVRCSSGTYVCFYGEFQIIKLKYVPKISISGGVPMRGSDNIDYVKISACIFLHDYRTKNGDEASGVLFNKFMTLLHRRFKNEGFDMKLPHCWYRWGDEVVRHHMPYLDWNHDYAAYTKVSWKGAYPEYDTGDPTVLKISQYSNEFISKYSGPEGAEMAIDEVYEEAPFEFQNEYRKLRESLKTYKREGSFISNYRKLIGDLFKSAMDKFPNKEFRSITEERKDFEEVFHFSLREGADPSQLFRQAEDFWFFFCYHLRLNEKCHENVPRTSLDVWEEKIPWETDLFNRKLQDNVNTFSQKSKSKRSPTIERLSEEWTERNRNFESLLSDISDDDAEEFEKFINGKG